jgi:hypothetical protein
MKNLFSCSILVFLLAATASPSWAGTGPIFKAKVSGTVRTQLILGPSDGKIDSSSLNNSRIFDEFAVSPNDYELVTVLSGGLALVLLPKSASSGLPTITVFTMSSVSTVVDTHKNTFEAGGAVSSPATSGLFKDLTGELQGAVKFKGTFSSPTITKVAVDGHARGNVGSASLSFLTIKLSTGALFVQGP